MAVYLNTINYGLAAKGEGSARVRDKLYSELKKAGYDGLVDINDKYLSGYGTRNPTIIFNGAEKASVVARNKLSDAKIVKDYLLSMGDVQLKQAVKIGAPIAAVSLASDTINSQNYDRTLVKNYRKKNPDSKLTYDEILKKKG